MKEAKTISPDNLDINLDYANILSSLGKKEEAISNLKSIENKHKQDAKIYYNLGCLSIDIENFEDAIEYLKRTLELDPKNKQASFNFGVSFFNTKKYEKTIKIFSSLSKRIWG